MLQQLRAPSLVLLLTVLLAGCGNNGPASGGQAALPPLVTAGSVEQVMWQDEIQALGTAQANESRRRGKV